MRVAVAGSSGRTGSRVVQALAEQGHEVVGLSRAAGVDLTADGVVDDLVGRLAGVDVVMDLTNVITQDRAAATTYLSAVARNLGESATLAGVARTVLLSIIGVDRIPDDAHYAAKYAQEQVHRAHSPGLRIVRAAHFHEFAAMALAWGRGADNLTISDFPVQPVQLDVVVQALLRAADGTSDDPVVEVAGPRAERLAEMVARLAEAGSDGAPVAAVPASPALNGGACLPGPHALIDGPSFDDWLASEGATAAASRG